MNGAAPLSPEALAALWRLLPAVVSASAIASLAFVALLLFARDRSRRDLLLYGILAAGIAAHLLLRPPVLSAAGFGGELPARLRNALSFLLPATGWLFLLRLRQVPLGRARLALLVLPFAGVVASALSPPALARLLPPLSGALLALLGADVFVALSHPSRRRRPDTGLLFVATGSLLLLALVEAALSEGVLLLPSADVPLLGPGFLLFSALLLVALADEGRRLLVRATTDPLTNVPNRAAFVERARRELERASRTGETLAVAMLDVDRFKSFNDRFGHQTGDRVLSAVAQSIQKSIRGSDLVGRYGGEEFVLLLVDADEKSAVAAVERVRAAISAIGPPRVPERITCSAGVIVHHGRFERASLTGLVAAADAALYESKKAGRDRTTLAITGEERPTSPAEVRYR